MIKISYHDLGVEFRDSGRFRSYELNAQGTDLSSLCADATISEVDQDGGEIRSYGIDDAEDEVADAAQGVLKKALERNLLKQAALA